MSRLAIAALVLAVVPLCPPANLAGAFAGALAGRRIRMAPQRLRGRGMARAAVLAGWLSCFAWSCTWWWVAEAARGRLQGSMELAVRETIAHGVDRPESVRTRHWASAVAPPAGALRDLSAAAAERYGALERVTVTSMSDAGTMTQPTFMAAFTLHFAQRTQRLGSARFEAAPGTIQMRLTRLVVSDPELGDLVLGEERPAVAAP
jgi:hypothetical protein